MRGTLTAHLREILGMEPHAIEPLHGGSIAQVYRVALPDGRALVAKVSSGEQGNLSIEAYMLDYLKRWSSLPVPDVLYSDDRLLLLTFMPGSSFFSAQAEQHAARLLAELHTITAPHFGLSRDTLIGGLHQPNTPAPRWIDFFREQRLLYMTQVAYNAGQLATRLRLRLEAFAARLEAYLEEPEQPALLHGDVWTTNVLAQGSRISAFLDPAIYYGHPEIELAFITLFSTFGDSFFKAYHALRPIRQGFFESRRDIYNLYPLLVHVRLFGGGYTSAVERILSRFER